jgi:hypothetical protein
MRYRRPPFAEFAKAGSFVFEARNRKWEFGETMRRIGFSVVSALFRR